MSRHFGWVFGATALVLAGCVPAAFHARAWDTPPAPAYAGPLAPNHDLERAVMIAEGQLDEPEDVAVDLGVPGRPLFTGQPDGRLLRIDPVPGAPARVTTLVTFSGPPLGLKMGADGVLYVCVQDIGLVAVATRAPNTPVTILASACDGRPFHFLNDVDVARDGTVYFSESSPARYGARGYDPIIANLEGAPEGSLYAYDPRTHKARRLLDGLYFANGVAVSDDQQSVLVVETSRNAIRRYWLAGPKQGQNEVFADNLPGLADGIMGDGHGRYWVAMNARRSALMDFAGPRPWLREVCARLPGALLLQLGVGEAYGLVVAYDDHGRAVRSLHDGTGRFVGGLANAEPYGDMLYLGTKWGHHVAVVPLPRD